MLVSADSFSLLTRERHHDSALIFSYISPGGRFLIFGEVVKNQKRLEIQGVWWWS